MSSPSPQVPSCEVCEAPPAEQSETLRVLRRLLADHHLPAEIRQEVRRVDSRVAALEGCARAVSVAVEVKLLPLERVAEFLTRWKERFLAGPRWQATAQPGVDVQEGVPGQHARVRVERVRFWGWLSEKEAERRVRMVLGPMGLERAGAWAPAGNGSFEAPVLPPVGERK